MSVLLACMSAALKQGGPTNMLIMMMAIITVWKAGPHSLKAVPAIRARPMATPACRNSSGSRVQWLRAQHKHGVAGSSNRSVLLQLLEPGQCMPGLPISHPTFHTRPGDGTSNRRLYRHIITHQAHVLMIQATTKPAAGPAPACALHHNHQSPN